MSAVHPVTGKQIRIIESEGCVWRDAKTLVWLDGTEEAAKWNRYDVGVSSAKAFETVLSKGIEVDACVVLDDAGAEWIRSKSYKSVRIFAVSKTIIDEVGPEFFVKERIDNMVCLEDALELYPILQTAWNGTEADARLMLAILLQYKRTGPIDETKTSRGTVAKMYGLAIISPAPPKPLYLITQFYTCPKPRRAQEIVQCLKMNAGCEYIDKIVLLNEQRFDIPIKSSKIEQRVIGHRLNFKTVFKYICDSVPANAIVVIANSDIYLDSSWRAMWSVSMHNTWLSLLRWDESENPLEKPTLFGPRSDSQDTWVVDSNSVKERTWNWDNLDIPFGQNGCDNAINAEMLQNKFMVANPCMSLITHHVHMSGYRTYEPTNIISRPVFMYVRPSGIHDLKPEYSLVGKPFETLKVPSYRPVIRCTNAAVFNTMLSKKHEEFAKTGIMFPGYNVPLCTYDNVLQTKDGLLQTYNSILVGKSKVVSDTWSESEMSILAPCVSVDVALVAFCPDSVASSPWKYMAHYLGKILYMRRKIGTGEFLGTEEMQGVLEKFNWRVAGAPKENNEVPVLLREAAFQAWSKKAHVWYPQGGFSDLISPVEIQALRESVIRRRTAEGHLVFCLDPLWITKEFVANIETALGTDVVIIEEDDSTEEIMDLLTGASGLIGLADSHPLWGAWLLPKSAFLIEVQVEASPSIEIAHLCTVCDVEQYIQVIPRARPHTKKDIENLAENILKILKKPVEELTAEILVPHSATTGYFAHAGDSFREMLKIWAERDYVPVKEVRGLSNIWLGGVGKVLLYDRPTLEWFHASPEEEQVWNLALFGNPTPLLGAHATAWSFWPRRPRLVEEIASKPRTPFEERTRRVVFYGKSENAVQLRNRSKTSWASACTEFVHITSATEKYPYTHEEYLERLRGSLFGLCLAGYGKKCHREIECMAMGCVPVVAPEVDMTSYAVAPVEGVHYLRVKSPEELLKKTNDISAEQWETMSVAAFTWWKNNASAEGMWELTKRLAGLL